MTVSQPLDLLLPNPSPDELGIRTLRKVTRRLIPFMCFLYLLAYLDRVNVGFAGLQMTASLHFSETVFGLGNGIFFIGYFLFEVPSNFMLHRTGAGKWIARIMVTWGLVAMAMMFVRGRNSFYTLRFLLGVAEAGFFPGMILYLTYWFPRRYRARTMAMFFTSTAVAGVVGGPISGLLLSLDGKDGLSGWQWLFLLEGLPSVIVGMIVWFYMTDKPEHAGWLTPQEQSWLKAELESDETDHQNPGPAGRSASHAHFGRALLDLRLWILSAIYFTLTVGLYVVSIWMPKIIKATLHYNDQKVGFVSAIPYGLAVAVMILISRHSDRTRNRRLHVAVWGLVAAAGLALTPFCHTPLSLLTALSLAAIGIWSAIGPFWAIPADFLRGTAAAGGIAAINSIGNLGGFGGNQLVGYMRDKTHNYTAALLIVAAIVAMGSVLVLSLSLVRPKPARDDDT